MRQRHVAPAGRRNRPIAVAGRLGEHPRNLRDTAVQYLTEKIAAGEAGVDPFDNSLLVLQAHPHETVWAFRMLSQVGLILFDGGRDDRGRRYKAAVSAEARDALGLDKPDAPMMADRVAPALAAVPDLDAPTVLMDAVFEALPGTESGQAIRAAKEAYERQYVDMCVVCDTAIEPGPRYFTSDGKPRHMLCDEEGA